MPKIGSRPNAEDRYLEKRSDGGYRYQRFVPGRFQALDGRRIIRLSLHTDDLAEARLRRDAQEEADNQYWQSLAADDDGVAAARARYDAATARARAMGFAYRDASDLAASAHYSAVVRRVERLEAAGGLSAPALDRIAALGTAPAPEAAKVTVSRAFAVYFDDIEAGQKVSKSPAQYRNWRKVKERARKNFIEVVGDKAIDEITREDAQTFYRHWQGRIAAREVTANSAARDFGNIRVLFASYMRWTGRRDAQNPFSDMHFTAEYTKSRPPFETDHIRKHFLKPGPITLLNAEARAIFLVLIETGCRPSEIANLRAGSIRLDARVPHLSIEPERGLEIKTRTSIRKIPLVGVALEAMRRHPAGFPRYFDKPDVVSATLMKWLRNNKLQPTPAHKIYSVRHSFKKRAQEGGLSDMLIDTLMGHADQKPVYGDGGSLEWRRAELAKIALPFDKAIFD